MFRLLESTTTNGGVEDALNEIGIAADCETCPPPGLNLEDLLAGDCQTCPPGG